MRLRRIIALGFVLLAGGGYAWSVRSASAVGDPQQRRGRRNGSTRRPGTATPPKDYSRFSHRSEKHAGLACAACHVAPSGNWMRDVGYPDVADYPGHAACVRCHRTEFFRGARPVICSICHTKTSPRDEARFSFAKPSGITQFAPIFPHDRHQDVIAAIRSLRETETAHAVPTAQQNNPQKYNNCTICHGDETRTIVPANAEGFAPPVGTFKTAPSGHASCFTCHWQNQQPTRVQCAGCHHLSPQDLPVAPPPNRTSLKFLHTREQHVKECTACHINITAAATLAGLRPDVPITACSECHKTSTAKDVVTLEIEVAARDKSAAFTCVKCHTPTIGSRPVPNSHRALFPK